MQAALKSLRALGIEDDRIQIRRIGGGWPHRAVVFQNPAPGTVLTSRDNIVLEISAPSALDALPYAMRDGVEGALGTERFMPILDNPIAKLEAFIDDAGGFFELRPERPETGWRWIREIFQLDPGEIPDDFVYRFARFLPALYRVAGTERGVDLGLRTLFDLPLKGLQLRPVLVPLLPERYTRLGVQNGRLGVDSVIGDGVTVRAQAVVTIGPVTLAEYVAHDTAARRRHRELLYQLVLPSAVLQPVQEVWYVLPPAAGLVLGSATEPVRLGLNTRFTTVTTQGS